MPIRILETDLRVLTMHTRMPFRYGQAALTALPHVILTLDLEINGKSHRGFAADGLPPMWFIKDPDLGYEQELALMIGSLRQACDESCTKRIASSVFDLWWSVYESHHAWAAAQKIPPLLAGHAVSLIERACIDAFCRASGIPFHQAVNRNTLGIDLSRIHRELAEYAPKHLLPEQPTSSLRVRHTIGLGDPLTKQPNGLQDGLPEALDDVIRTYGVNRFKIKLAGDPDQDLERLKDIAAVIGRNSTGYAVTIDANERYKSVETFRATWEKICAAPYLKEIIARTLCVEQPLTRDIALLSRTGDAWHAWEDRPPLIIDESDATLDALPRALDRGYDGTSHKNCKGIFKSIANACLIEHRRREDSERELILTAEDLANVGPIALQQDLAVVATLGLEHAERNGHHYFRGLSAWPKTVQDQTLAAHGDLYHAHRRGFAALTVEQGRLRLDSVNRSPFGLGFTPDSSAWMPLDHWSVAMLNPDET